MLASDALLWLQVKRFNRHQIFLLKFSAHRDGILNILSALKEEYATYLVSLLLRWLELLAPLEAAAGFRLDQLAPPFITLEIKL